MLPRAMMVSIGLVGLLYVLMSLTVFGNLDVQEVVDAKDYALARAASPVLGKTGFLIVGIAAMISTASAINANLYAVTNVSYRMATSGELPASFGRPVAHSRAGLVISAAIVAALTPMLNLTSLAVIGSLTILVVHVIVHVGHLRVLAQTGASGVLVGLAMLANGGVIAAVLAFEFRDSPSSLPRLLAFVSAAAILELIFRHMRSRRITRRDREPTGVAAHHGSTSGDV
jgi:amino acid transporter